MHLRHVTTKFQNILQLNRITVNETEKMVDMVHASHIWLRNCFQNGSIFNFNVFDMTLGFLYGRFDLTYFGSNYIDTAVPSFNVHFSSFLFVVVDNNLL